VRMCKLLRYRYLSVESVTTASSGKFGPQDLECHLAVMLEIPGQIHSRYATRAEFALDLVSVG